MAIVPSPPMEISGSLLPSVSSKGVSVNVGGGLAVTESDVPRRPVARRIVREVPATRREDVRMTASHARSNENECSEVCRRADGHASHRERVFGHLDPKQVRLSESTDMHMTR